MISKPIRFLFIPFWPSGAKWKFRNLIVHLKDKSIVNHILKYHFWHLADKVSIYTCNNDEQWGLYHNERFDLRRRSSFATVLAYSLFDEKLLFHLNSLKFVFFTPWNRAYQTEFVYNILKQGKLYQNFTIHAPMTLGQVFLC